MWSSSVGNKYKGQRKFQNDKGVGVHVFECVCYNRYLIYVFFVWSEISFLQFIFIF